MGEEKRLCFEIKSKTGRDLVIAQASFKLIDNGEVIQEGSCSVEGLKLNCLVKPDRTGAMYLEITYIIAPETRKARITINVI